MWLVTIAIGFYATATGTFLAHGPALLVGSGFPRVGAALTVSIFAIGTIAGTLLAGVVGDRREPRILLGIGFFLLSAGLACIIENRFANVAYAGSLALGLGNGIVLVCWPAILVNYFGSAHFARMLSMQLPFITVLGALGPLVSGRVYDLTGSYSPAFSVLAMIGTGFSLMVGTMAKAPEYASAPDASPAAAS
jgi:MFS family permease